MTDEQWRMLMTEILETRNEASASHAFLENRLEDLRVRLDAIEQRLAQLKGVAHWPTAGDCLVPSPARPDTGPGIPPITPEQLAEYWQKVEGWAAEYRRM